ncbi:acetyl-CoA acetyltransferase [Hyphomonas johnsonii]|uniref:Acetyl-CoA acetyltransferase n=1 Tax=Hyphomonas johnsonii MHS-2 TaxID=1280950 RepID=A0A059F9T3_9PROT|nr:acetyl-CoA acetyltransferase [Hyphomonas johnsonii]KCZ87360.1 acetyl-CoA acetyltransferase [Hyphomonas johnsonii MHS-2]
MAKGDMPVLVGVGQSLSQWDGTAGPADAPSPLSLMTDASRAALDDVGVAGLAEAIDALAVVRIFEDSIGRASHPHGHNSNLPGTLARDLGARPAHLIYEAVGGQSPQALVNEMAGRIHAGEIECALISGSEANRASKGARRHGVEIDWTDGDDATFEDRGMGPMLLSRTEIKHGLVAAAYFYGLFENAIAAREGRTRSQHRRAMAELFQPFSAIAARNPFSQFPVEHSVDFLATASRENYEYADPFLKWFIAQDAVNQGAAAIIMSSSKADTLGVPQAKRIYLQGGGEAGDDHISVRPRLDGSWAMEVAASRALEQAGVSPADIRHFDLYSCFPCAVFSSTAALGIDWKTDPRPLTLTGGLPFFGGPGNNYSLHGIAEMVHKLRSAPGDLGLVLANGGWMTKEAVGIYSATAPKAFTPAAPAAKAKDQVTLCDTDCDGTLETFTVTHGREGPESGIIFARLADGRRALARATPAALAILREETSPVGRKVAITVADEVGTFDFI